MRSPLTTLLDLGIGVVGLATLAAVILGLAPVQAYLDQFEFFGGIDVLLKEWPHWTLELSSTLGVLFVGRLVSARMVRGTVVRASRRVVGKPLLDAIADSAIDLSGVSRESPDAVDQVGEIITRRAKGETMEVVDLVDDIIVAAEFLGASDVHVEPKETQIRLSFRVDGVMREVGVLPKDIEARLTNRFRVISHLDFAKVDTPQDGRVEEKIRGRQMNLRVSVFPTLWGAKVVLRLLDSGAHALPELAKLGIEPEVLNQFRKLIHAPQGLMLITGPTGSGKTTLMYSSLMEIVHGEEILRNIVTLEDPIERVVAAVNQTQVDAKRGLSFASGLRTILRQDPDVIMVGEIRDVETAEIALRAGQTGHLILTTLHTNSSASAFGRLIDMGLEPFLLASAVSGVIGTRLVRRLCPNCRIEKAPSEILLTQLPERPTFTFYESKGCEECRGTGFIGRMLVFELLPMNEALAAAVLAKSPPLEIHRLAISQGMNTMLQDGLRKVQEGETSLAELLRVVQ